MIQTLNDVLLLTAIIALGVVSFLLAILLYHCIFVVMDLRQILRRMREWIAQVEEMLLSPVRLVSEVVDWVVKMWETCATGSNQESRRERRKRKRKRVKGGFERTEV